MLLWDQFSFQSWLAPPSPPPVDQTPVGVVEICCCCRRLLLELKGSIRWRIRHFLLSPESHLARVTSFWNTPTLLPIDNMLANLVVWRLAMLVNLVAERLDVLTDRINRTTGHAHQTCLIGRRSGHVCQPCYERKTGHAHQSCSKDGTCSPELLERRDMLTRDARKTGHTNQLCCWKTDHVCQPCWSRKTLWKYWPVKLLKDDWT